MPTTADSPATPFFVRQCPFGSSRRLTGRPNANSDWIVRTRPMAPGLHHLARLRDHRIAAVAVHDAEHELALLDQADELVGFGDARRHGLFAQHMKPGLHQRARDLEMRVVRREHAYEVDAIVPVALARDELGDVRVHAVGRHELRGGVAAPPLGVDVEGAGAQLEALGDTLREPVRAADGRKLPPPTMPTRRRRGEDAVSVMLKFRR
jgi:hypothetical protein